MAAALVLLVGIAGCDAGFIETISFSTGGSECNPGDAASTFAAGSVVHTVASYAPPLAVGDRITITVSKDGTPQTDLGGTADVTEEGQDCVYVMSGPLDAGHYRIVINIDPNATDKAPLSGEFDVTP